MLESVAFEVEGGPGTYETMASRRQLRGRSLAGIACPSSATKAECEAAVKQTILASAIADDVVDVVVTILTNSTATIELIVDSVANAAASPPKRNVAEIKAYVNADAYETELSGTMGTITISNVRIGTLVVTQSPSAPLPLAAAGDDDDDMSSDADDDVTDNDNDDDSGVVSEDDDDDIQAAKAHASLAPRTNPI